MIDCFKILLFGVILIEEAFCIDHYEYWETIANNTKPAYLEPKIEEYYKHEEQVFYDNKKIVNWNDVNSATKEAEKGISPAQYMVSQYLLTVSQRLFRKEQRNIRFNAYMYLLIAATKGKFRKAIDTFNKLVDSAYAIPTFQDDNAILQWMINVAEKLSQKPDILE